MTERSRAAKGNMVTPGRAVVGSNRWTILAFLRRDAQRGSKLEANVHMSHATGDDDDIIV
jgi:hypothetical protein